MDDTILQWCSNSAVTREYRLVDGCIYVRNPGEGRFANWRPSVEYYGAVGWKQLLADKHVKAPIPSYLRLSEGL